MKCLQILCNINKWLVNSKNRNNCFFFLFPEENNDPTLESSKSYYMIKRNDSYHREIRNGPSLSTSISSTLSNDPSSSESFHSAKSYISSSGSFYSTKSNVLSSSGSDHSAIQNVPLSSGSVHSERIRNVSSSSGSLHAPTVSNAPSCGSITNDQPCVLSTFTFHNVLGKGSFGTVLLASHPAIKQKVAIKLVKKSDLENETKLALVEGTVLKVGRSCRFITHLYGSFQTKVSLSTFQFLNIFPVLHSITDPVPKIFIQLVTFLGAETYTRLRFHVH